MQFITARWNIVNGHRAAGIGNSVIRSLERYDYGAHFRMNIAKDVADALAVKNHGAAAAGLVKSQVEAFPFEKRKNIVEERVFVWKDHGTANLHHDQMGSETLIFLHQLLFWRGRNTCRLDRISDASQPHDAIGRILHGR